MRRLSETTAVCSGVLVPVTEEKLHAALLRRMCRWQGTVAKWNGGRESACLAQVTQP